MDPGRRRMFDERALLPTRRLTIIAGMEMRAADPHQIVERERIVRREVEGDLEPLDGRSGISPIKVDPAAAAPGPCRAAVGGECAADHQLRRFEAMQQSKSVAKD